MKYQEKKEVLAGTRESQNNPYDSGIRIIEGNKMGYVADLLNS